jgi:hypothetical protein
MLLSLAGCAAPRPAVSSPPARHVSITQEAADRLVERIAAAIKSEGVVRLHISEDESSSYLSLGLFEHPVERVQVWFDDERTHILATMDVLGPRALHAVLGFSIDGGRLHVHIQEGDLDGRPLPRFLLKSAQSAVNDALSDAQMPLWIERVHVSEGSLLIEATSRSAYP